MYSSRRMPQYLHLQHTIPALVISKLLQIGDFNLGNHAQFTSHMLTQEARDCIYVGELPINPLVIYPS